MTLTSNTYRTWCKQKYYRSQMLGHMFGCVKLLANNTGSHVSRNALCLNEAICRHFTETTQASTWQQPKGYDSKVKVYNPILKETVPLIFIKEKLAQWYACGPTVYDSAHIGHASSYVRLDIIRRILSTFNVDTFLVMGVTDIDDKIINKSNETGQTLSELTKFFESDFFTSLHKLKVSPPNLIVRVTDHVGQIIEFISRIETKGMTYTTPDGSVYFDVARYGQYGVFSGGSSRDLVTEVDSYKKSPQDFALWKAVKPREPSWQSPWGPGRPGWHIECSAMASKVFGANFDIHTGGEDLSFPHHENELAQSCVYHGRSQWANYWIHTGHLFVSGQSDKMSKSLKNVIGVTEFLQNYSANHFRMLCLLSHYRNKIEYSDERMNKAVSTLTAFESLISRCDAYIKGQIDTANIPETDFYEKLQSTRQVVQAAYADDFNTPRALANLVKLVKFTNQFLDNQEKVDSQVRSVVPVAMVGQFLESTLKKLGLDLAGKKTETETSLQLNDAVDTLVSSRSQLRQFAKDKQFFLTNTGAAGIPEDQALRLMKRLYKPLWKISDRMRADILSSANVQISDDDKGTSRWSFVDPKKKTNSNVTEKTDDVQHGQQDKLI